MTTSRTSRAAARRAKKRRLSTFRDRVGAARRRFRPAPTASVGGLGAWAVGERSTDFELHLPVGQQEAVAAVVTSLGYFVKESRVAADRCVMTVHWGGAGYPGYSARQRQDLAAALCGHGFSSVIVDGPTSISPRLPEWRVVAGTPDEAALLHAWLEERGRAEGAVAAPSCEDAAEVVGQWPELPPVDWKMEAVSLDDSTDEAEMAGRKWRQRRLVLTGVLASATFAGGGYLGVTYPLPVGQTGSWLEISSGDPWGTYLYALLGAVVMTAAPVVAFLMGARPARPKRPETLSRAATEEGRLARWAGALINGLLFIGVFGVLGWIMTPALFPHPLACACGVLLWLIVASLVAVLDPPDRVRPQLSAAAFLAFVGGWGWTVAPDQFLAVGLGLSPGTVHADVFSRTAALAVLLGPACLIFAAAFYALRRVRREGTGMATMSVLIPLLGATLAVTAGVGLLADEAVRVPQRPGQGVWAMAAQTQVVGGVPPVSSKPGAAPTQGLFVVVGEVGGRAVLVTHACSGPYIVRLVPAATLTFAPAWPAPCGE